MICLLNNYLRADPAARSRWEILFLYPGVKAIAFHRVANLLWRARLFFLARVTSEMGRFVSGIEIHPGAQIGRSVVFDHGMGIVIGETAIIGDGSILYQGVTLGGTSRDKAKRHPTLGKCVVVGAGAKVLGNICIGDGSRIGANSVVIEDVPAHCTVVGIPGRILQRGIQEGEELLHDKIKEPC